MSPAGFHRSDRNKHPPFERQIWCAGQSVQGRVCGAGCAGRGLGVSISLRIYGRHKHPYAGMRGKVRGGEGCSIYGHSVCSSLEIVTISVRAGCAARTRVQ